ncbi:hypothetical protein JAAARDRAFT_36696 [Jaapia argillacea MUCL 33604]|uniref:F-box domain-containing protein n=1 Tax=Jaapia argillacea MUCL 33604 TaxID=933084 RepID=A0A067PMC3_9AGAM|nr:hypothetical protein JAAARDRAFT_36696 [Jaapia argillacea MUCL 33604]
MDAADMVDDIHPPQRTILPVELILYIFQLASSSSRACLTISLVSKVARHQTLPRLFNTILLTSPSDRINATDIPHASLIHNLWLHPCLLDDTRCPQGSRPCDFLSQPLLTNITNLALPHMEYLNCMDCDEDAHGNQTALSNLSECHSLTIYQFDGLIYIGRRAFEFMTNNITHLQLHGFGSSSDRPSSVVGWCLQELRVLTHLAVPFKELIDSDAVALEITEYQVILMMASTKRLMLGMAPLEVLVMMVDWKSWLGKWGMNEIAESMFTIVLRITLATSDGLVLVEWGREESEVPGRLTESDEGPGLIPGVSDPEADVRALWRAEALGGETIWERAINNASSVRDGPASLQYD